jgi:hypothetical protein
MSRRAKPLLQDGSLTAKSQARRGFSSIRCQTALSHPQRSRLDTSVSCDCGGYQRARGRDGNPGRRSRGSQCAGPLSDFGALQRLLGGRGGKRASTESVLFAFDLLYFDGHDLTKTELSVRRHLLTDLLDGAVGARQLSEEVQGDGAELSKTPARLDWKASSQSTATAGTARAGPATAICVTPPIRASAKSRIMPRFMSLIEPAAGR